MMKQEQKVFIRGVEGRGSEVIKMLEDRGADNESRFECNQNDRIYFIDHYGHIDSIEPDCELGRIIMDNYRELELGQWKDGDVLINTRFSDIFAVCKSFCNTRGDAYHCYMYADFGSDVIDTKEGNVSRPSYRLATPAEVECFHELLHRHGKEWNAEKKQLVDWRWKPKNEETYYFIDTNTSVYETAYDENNINDFLNYEAGNCFRTREEAEAMAAKFKKLLKGGEK